MIKLFRHIRQRLVTENKLNKYLLYAIGEIVLVVIGILIALQVNNWNEDRKISRQEQDSLKRLHDESEDIVAYLAKSVAFYNELINAAEQSAEALNNKSMGALSEEAFAYGIYGTAYYEAIAPPKNVFEELNGTGKVQNIKSTSVRKSISEYYSKLEYLNVQLVYFRNQYTRPIDAAEEGFLFRYDKTSSSKVRSSVNFEKLAGNDLFKSKQVKALRDLYVFNTDRIELLNTAQLMCREIANELKSSCSSN